MKLVSRKPATDTQNFCFKGSTTTTVYELGYRGYRLSKARTRTKSNTWLLGYCSNARLLWIKWVILGGQKI